jgi:hypothetical protein
LLRERARFAWGEIDAAALAAAEDDATVAIIGSRVQWTDPINAADAAFLKTRSDRWPKITIPGPCALHFRGGDAAVTESGIPGRGSVLVGYDRGFHAGAPRPCGGGLSLYPDRQVRRSPGAKRARRARRRVERAD